MIIVIEGTDGSGKQTQTKLLVEYLKAQGFDVKTQSFPNYESDSSFFVKKYLNGDFGGLNALSPFASSTFFALDRLITMESYKSYLSNGGVLVLDRYVSSNILHQGGKILDKAERENFCKKLEDFEYKDLNLPKEDLTIFLDLDPKISDKLREERGILKSGTKKDIHESDREYLHRCYEFGIIQAKNNNWEIIKCFDENGILSINDIHQKIVQKVNSLLKRK